MAFTVCIAVFCSELTVSVSVSMKMSRTGIPYFAASRIIFFAIHTRPSAVGGIPSSIQLMLQEFLIEKNGVVVPVEVKSSNAASVSLNNFINDFKPKLAYKFISNRKGITGVKEIIYNPSYELLYKEETTSKIVSKSSPDSLIFSCI